jgi:SAM-dependent methyltransferase
VETNNPWLTIAAREYVGHMADPEVGQLSVLSGLLREILETCRPRDLLVLGCTTGNGFEHVDPTVTFRVTGVDINPEYLRILRQRFPNPGWDLTLRCEDAVVCDLPVEAYDLVHCALLFEYIDWPALMPRVAASLREAGHLVIVLQRRSSEVAAVTPTACESLRALEVLFRFVEPAAVLASAARLGLELWQSWEQPLKQGKSFSVIVLRKRGAPTSGSR